MKFFAFLYICFLQCLCSELILRPLPLLVSTIDGSLRGIDRQTGTVIWSTNPTIPFIQSNVPVVYIPEQGALFLGKQLERLPMNLKDIVKKSPFKTAHGSFFLGHKQSRIDWIDTETGEWKERGEGTPIGRVEWIVEVFEEEQLKWEIQVSEFRALHSYDVNIEVKQSPHGLKSAKWELLLDGVVNVFEIGDFGLRRVSSKGIAFVENKGRILAIPKIAIDGESPLLIEGKSEDICRPKRCRPGSLEFPRCLESVSWNEQNVRKSASKSNIYALIGSSLLIIVVSILFLVWQRARLKHSEKEIVANKKVENKSPKKKSKKNIQKGLDVVREKPLIVSDEIIGRGSHGTLVFKGKFEGRNVAVKRLLVDFYDVAHHEVKLLQHSDDHPNVIRYFYKEQSEEFLYLALELCQASLYDLFTAEHVKNLKSKLKAKEALLQIGRGIEWLHNLNIVHRDIKPQNILVSESHVRLRFVISDFGLCKKLEDDQSSFHNTIPQGAGTVGWRAPECLIKNSDLRITRAVDIFAAGCVYYFVLSDGKHPFGERFVRESNIILNKSDLSLLKKVDSEAEDLVRNMIEFNTVKRPSAHRLAKHPFFWSCSKKLSFLQECSDRFEIEEAEGKVLQSVEENGYDVVGNWLERIDPYLLENLCKYRKYDGKSVRDLLRAIRNKKHHYQDLPVEVKQFLGPPPDAFLKYFSERFPKLFLHVYHCVEFAGIIEEEQFSEYN